MPCPRIRLRHASIAACAAALATACALVPWRDAAPLFERVTLARPGDNGVHTYRIPALAVAKDGTLLASYDARLDAAHDLPGNIDILLRRSRDDGRTWSAPQTVVRHADGSGAGDSSLLVDRDTGRVFLFYAWAPPGVGFWNAQAGNAPGSRTQHPRYMWSDDNGASWQGPRDLLAAIKRPGWMGMFATSGHGIQLLDDRAARGRLIQPYVFRGPDKLIHAVNAYSDDHGASWHIGVPLDGRLDENKAVELADGTVMQNSRSSDADVHARVVALSRDGGIHFGPARPDPQLPDPHDNGDLIRVAPDAPANRPEAHWLLFSNTADPAERRRLTIRMSCDDGRHWNAGRVLDPGDAMYSAMARLPDGSFGIFWEDGDGNLSYARFGLAWLGQPCRA
jgi:sialidase-1